MMVCRPDSGIEAVDDFFMAAIADGVEYSQGTRSFRGVEGKTPSL